MKQENRKMPGIRLKRLIAVIAVVAMVATCIPAVAADNNRPSEVIGTNISGFSTTDLYGNAYDGSIFGEYDLTIMNYWATWCPPCLVELPHIQQIYENYSGLGVNVMGILSQSGSSTVSSARQVAEQYGLTYPTLIEDDVLRSITDQCMYIPDTFIVDREGNIVEWVVGAMSYEEFEALIDTWMTEFVEYGVELTGGEEITIQGNVPETVDNYFIAGSASFEITLPWGAEPAGSYLVNNGNAIAFSDLNTANGKYLYDLTVGPESNLIEIYVDQSPESGTPESSYRFFQDEAAADAFCSEHSADWDYADLYNGFYNLREYNAVRDFLAITDGSGVSNAEKLGEGVDLADPETWPGVTWTQDGHLSEFTAEGKGLVGEFDMDVCSMLNTVNLSGNPGIGTIALQGCYSLEYLYLSGCEITQFDASGMNELNVLDLSDNPLVDFKANSMVFGAYPLEVYVADGGTFDAVCNDTGIKVTALANDGMRFDGWYDIETGGYLSEEQTFVLTEGTYIVEARFSEGPVVDPTPTPDPIDPTPTPDPDVTPGPDDPTPSPDPVKPTPSPSPSDPPKAGSATLIGLGIAALLSAGGIGIGYSRKKRR